MNATRMVGKFKRTEVLLDNQADVSVVHPSLLREIGPAEENIHNNGVGSHQFTVEREGYLDVFFKVYMSEDTHTNVLSFSEVKDVYQIMYMLHESFTVHLPDHDIEFIHKGKMYIADWEEIRSAFTTTMHTKAEEL